MALLIEHLDRRVAEPLAICPGPGELTDHLRTLDCPVVHIPLYHIKPRTLLPVWRSSRRIRAFLRERRVDVIAPDASRDVLTCGLAKIGTPTRLLWFVRQTGHYPLDPLLERMADGMVGDSDDTGRRFSQAARGSGKFRAIWAGADLRRFRPAAERGAVRAALGLPAERLVLLFVGQVKRSKGVFDVVDALIALARQAPLPQGRPVLVLIGTPVPAEIVREIGARVAAGGVAEDVRVLPHRENVHEWMQAADLLVSGSHQDTEGMSRVLFEAMACGAVPVATDIRGNREALTPETGVLVAERAPAEIARAVRELAGDPRRLGRMREAGLRRARELFDISAYARGVERFCLELVGHAGRAA